MKFSFEEYHIWQQFANALICDKQVSLSTFCKVFKILEQKCMIYILTRFPTVVMTTHCDTFLKAAVFFLFCPDKLYFCHLMK